MGTSHNQVVERALGGAFNRPRDWQAFERLTRDLFAAMEDNDHVDLHGRSGQPQGGVDVYFTNAEGLRVGVQCKLHDAAQRTAEASAELTAEVAKARTFRPVLDRFIFLTTGANDVAIKQQAHALDVASRDNGGFEIHHHAWDWIETQLDHFPGIAVRYGLTAIRPAQAASPAMLKIGRRFDEAIALINAGRREYQPLEHASIAHFLGLADWRELEQISAGVSSANLPDLRKLAEGVGLNPDWLIHGRDEPFRLDDGLKDAQEQFNALVALKPRRIVFARSLDWPEDTVVAAQLDDIRWWVFSESHPTRPDVGATGRRQIFDFCCLVRRLYQKFWLTDTRLQGATISGDDYQRLINGRAHAGAILGCESNDHWWEDLAEMALDLPSDADPKLKAVIDLARYTLGQFQDASEESGRLDRLRDAGLPLSKADAGPRLDFAVAPPSPLAPPKPSGWPRVMALGLDKARFWFNAAHDHTLVDGACEVVIVNRAKIPLKDCAIRLVSIQSQSGNVVLDARFRTSRQGADRSDGFDLGAGASRTLLIARRDLKDIIGRPPWRLTLSTGDYDLPDGGCYRLRLELCSNYEFPTLLDLTLEVDHGKAVSATIGRQQV